MEDLDLENYFLRIGYEGPREVSFSVLSQIHQRQVRAIPYENISVLLGQPIQIDLSSIHEKLIVQKRGGYCFELNRLMWMALEKIGFVVKPLAARVFYRVPEGVVRPRTHMVLSVEIEGEQYLIDPGFGGFSLPEPLRMKVGIEQNSSHGLYRLEAWQEEISVMAKVQNEWQLLYRITFCESLFQDFELPNWYLSTHPNSHFRERFLLARIADEGRYTMLGLQSSFYPLKGESRKQELKSVEEFFAVLKRDFLLEFHDPANREALEFLVKKSLRSE